MTDSGETKDYLYSRGAFPNVPNWLKKDLSMFAIRVLQMAVIVYLEDDISPRRDLSRNEF